MKPYVLRILKEVSKYLVSRMLNKSNLPERQDRARRR
jgi:hypothetical protein